MRAVSVKIREDFRAKREKSFGLENALAGYCRRQWPDKTIQHVTHEWGLSESEASKVVYANASKNTLRKLLHHRRGGFALFVELLADACNTSIEEYIHERAERAAHERRTWEAEERRQTVLLALVAGSDLDAGGLDQPAGRRRAPDADLGRGQDDGGP